MSDTPPPTELAAPAARRGRGSRRPAKAAPAKPAAPPMAAAPVDGATLLRALCNTFRQYMVMAEEHRVACALWTVHTYAADASYFTPYLHVYSPVRECGKSTLLTVLASVARRAIKADAVSSAAMYRIIERQSPTLLLDELDTLLRQKESAERLRGILNSGFARDGRVLLCEGDAHDVREFPTYCPKVLAGIGELWDTVASRAVPILLDRASADQRRELRRLRGDRIHDELEPLRLDAARWAHDYAEALRDADPPVPRQLGARAADIWRPLLAIADVAGEEWPGLARLTAETLSVPRAETDWGVMLLEDVALFVQEAAERATSGHLATAALLEFLNQREDRPWPTFSAGDRPLNGQRLATLFRRFGIRPDVRRNGKVIARGYPWLAIHAAIIRYTTTPSETLPSVTPVTGVTHFPERAA